MKTYEYKTVTLRDDPEAPTNTEQLDAFGAQGWLVVKALWASGWLVWFVRERTITSDHCPHCQQAMVCRTCGESFSVANDQRTKCRCDQEPV